MDKTARPKVKTVHHKGMMDKTARPKVKTVHHKGMMDKTARPKANTVHHQVYDRQNCQVEGEHCPSSGL
ncbi:hypothetical protein [Bacillus sp. T33-2]|uniref:hypothetical protein n=1 Tax=Bacillus sp. T33-2 TaxID=2054168 RepID=UPI001158DAD3|nr:hypothetical protein [Bacillus sp. T33-2]